MCGFMQILPISHANLERGYYSIDIYNELEAGCQLPTRTGQTGENQGGIKLKNWLSCCLNNLSSMTVFLGESSVRRSNNFFSCLRRTEYYIIISSSNKPI